MKRKWISLLCALALAVSLAGCGASANSSAATYDMEGGAYAPQTPSAEPAEIEEMGYDSAEYAGGASNVSLPSDGRKIILNASLTIEALDFDATCTALMQGTEGRGWLCRVDRPVFAVARGRAPQRDL